MLALTVYLLDIQSRCKAVLSKRLTMNTREQRGIVIAATIKLTKREGHWIVPSQSAGDKCYTVDPDKGSCSCPDHQEAGFKCKHLYAVEFVIQRELFADGTVNVTETVTFTQRVTYKQPWAAYNRAQSIEKTEFGDVIG